MRHILLTFLFLIASTTAFAQSSSLVPCTLMVENLTGPGQSAFITSEHFISLLSREVGEETGTAFTENRSEATHLLVLSDQNGRWMLELFEGDSSLYQKDLSLPLDSDSLEKILLVLRKETSPFLLPYERDIEKLVQNNSGELGGYYDEMIQKMQGYDLQNELFFSFGGFEGVSISDAENTSSPFFITPLSIDYLRFGKGKSHGLYTGLEYRHVRVRDVDAEDTTGLSFDRMALSIGWGGRSIQGRFSARYIYFWQIYYYLVQSPDNSVQNRLGVSIFNLKTYLNYNITENWSVGLGLAMTLDIGYSTMNAFVVNGDPLATPHLTIGNLQVGYRF